MHTHAHTCMPSNPHTHTHVGDDGAAGSDDAMLSHVSHDAMSRVSSSHASQDAILSLQADNLVLFI